MSELNLKESIKKLNQIGIALSSETNLVRLLSLVVREARTFTRADAGSLYIRDGDRLCFEVAQNDTLERRGGSDAQAFKPFPVPLTRTSISGFVALTGKVLNIDDVYDLDADESVEFSFNREFDRRNNYRSRSMLAVPMLDHRHENIGVLQLINALDDKGEVVPFAQEVEELVLSLASQAAVAIRNAKLIDDIKKIFAALVEYSASAIDARSPHTAGHSRRVAAMSLLLAEAVSRQTEGRFAQTFFTPEELEELSYAAWLHDIGKIGVREQVLDKAGKLAPDRMALVEARFQRIDLALRLEFQNRILALYRTGEPKPDEVSVLEKEKKARLIELEQDLALITRLNQPGWINDEEAARLREIAAKEFKIEDGRTIRCLDDFELENLSVRKGNLTRTEYEEMQSHVVMTHDIVKKIPFTQELARIPLFAAAHHEMLNGTGYPHRLKADEIPIQARILGVVDIFDALVARDRPYKKAMPVEKALEILWAEVKAGRLDHDLVDLFIREGIGSEETVNMLSRQEERPLAGRNEADR
ncbi:MAG: HD domain-containing phosphohydrolase [Thermodesulfobacteriota bacterium]